MQTWGEVREAVAERAAALDPSRLTVGEAQGLLPVIVAAKNTLAAVEARLAARVAESDRWRVGGAKEPAEDLARRTGVPVAQARSVLDAGRALEELPELRAAALRGELSPAQTAVIADAAIVAPDAAGALLEAAGSGSFRELRDACLTSKAAADTDREATRRRIHAARGVWSRREADGSQLLTWRDNPERIAHALASLGDVRDELFQAARKAGRRERPETYDADALYVALTGRHAASDTESAPRGGQWGSAKVIVRVDAAAVYRGHPATGEVCEIAGSGPVAVSAVREMLASGAALAVVQTSGTAVTTVAHVPRPAVGRIDITGRHAAREILAARGRRVAGLVHPGRKPTAQQVTALLWISPTCSALGCTTTRCEIDHRTGWAVTKTTRLEDLDRLCGFHHDLKTRQGWRLVPGEGKRAFVPSPRSKEVARAP